MITQRILAVLAASLLVGAIAVAAIGPPSMPLGAALYMLNHDLMQGLQGGVEAHLNHWLWDDVFLPFLVRPAWLLPACIGLICAGLSLTLSTRQRGPQRSHRRRF